MESILFNKVASSIQLKVILAVSLVFIAILAVSTLLTVSGERRLASQIGYDKAAVMGHSFFDGVNTMMLTGNLDQKASLREKLMVKGVLDLRIIQAPGKISPTPPAESMPKDDLDSKALAGEEVTALSEKDGQRVVTVVMPIKATANYHGTDCLSCHQVQEGTVVGAIRTTYSLAELDGQHNRNLLINTGINVVLFVAGLAVVFLLLRHIVIGPIQGMRAAMGEIERNADLTRTLATSSGDEMGELAGSINSMLGKFRGSLSLVAETSQRLSGAADEIAAVAEKTAVAASDQLIETGHTSRFISDLKAIAHEVGQSSVETANASVDAEQQATQGTTMTRDAIGGIRNLVQEIDGTARLIEQLDERSKNVSNVLDVIREIAEQTNLLALNAAIEAARAGEAGRGFAVVADEVRKLATRSHESTRSIEDIVSQLQSEARQAVGAMGHARDSAEQRSTQLEAAIISLDQIATRVTDIRKLNAQMASAIQHQGELTDSGGQKVFNISSIAERTATDAMKTSGISEELVNLAHQMNASVSSFKLN
jgi:methyl-accepting chemotaxis protein